MKSDVETLSPTRVKLTVDLTFEELTPHRDAAYKRIAAQVTVPGIRSSIVVVVTTVAIGALKIYDIVAVMTGGRSNTSVLAFEMVNQQQRFQSYGHSAALAVVLFLFVTPLIVFNVIQIRKQREIR